jgi:crossover junction endodeoxyribonuclease RuvC
MYLALDISIKSTGYAIYSNDCFDWGTKSFDQKDMDYGALFNNYEQWLKDFIISNQIALVSMESTYFGMKGRSAYQLNVLNGLTHKIGYELDIERREYAPATIKKFITGSGRAKKEEVKKSIENLGFDVNNDDEADALALLKLTIERTKNESFT